MMNRDFGGTALEPVEPARDREFTLGPITLIGMGLVLCALCAVCFLWGYSVGHRSSAEPSAAQSATAGGQPEAQWVSGQAKPAASQNRVAPQADPQPASSDSVTPEAAAEDTTSAPAGAPAHANAAYPSPAAPSGKPAVVQAALPAQSAVQPAAGSGQVQAALGQGTPWMVQIAAVSHSEDADVLVSALRKKGYTVSARRDPMDNLLHVQVGPFATHADAASMRQRLLNDGYNALIEP